MFELSASIEKFITEIKSPQIIFITHTINIYKSLTRATP